MASRPDNSPLVVIVGVTGSGKSALSIELAQTFNGEIVAADSRTVYKGLDIGTAKPTTSERRTVRHHLIDVVSPEEIFTVADFKIQAQEAIDAVVARGRVPLLVGGTGLYIDALLYDFSLRPTVVDDTLRAKLSRQSPEELRQHILDRGLKLPIDDRNPRRLLRTIEANGALSRKEPMRPNTLLIGLSMDREVLHKRITLRVDQMVDAGLVEELGGLSKRYGWEAQALQTPGFKAFRNFLEGAYTLDQAKQEFVRNDMNLAKRQYTWFKRNKDVHWVDAKEKAVELVTTFLNKY
jgi:tRNA dimethylallyltransferase